MGGRLLEIGAEVFPSPALELYRDLVATGRAAGHQPLAFAVVARFLGVPLQEALAAYLFATVTSLTHLTPDDLGAVSPGLEISQMRHERQRARMFMS